MEVLSPDASTTVTRGDRQTGRNAAADVK